MLLSLLILNLVIVKKIRSAYYLDEEKRSVHVLLVWLLPVLGIILTKSFWKKPSSDLKVMTKKSRKSNSGGFHESGHYLYGGND